MSDAMTVDVLDEKRRADWDAYLQKNERAIAWQSYGWHDILNNHHPHDFFPLACFRGREIRGVFPLYLLHDKAFSSRFLSVPFAVAGGIVSDSPEIDRLLLDGALALAGRSGVSSLVLKQYKHKIAGDLRADESYHNRELSLSPGTSRLWENIAPENRNMISEARGGDYALEYPSRGLADFHALLLSECRRQGIPCVSRGWIEDLVRSDMYSCALVRRRREIIAGTLVKTFKKTVSFPFTSLKSGKRALLPAAFWLYWELITAFAAEGYEIFHSGRLPANEAAACYRLGWNGRTFPYFYQYYPNAPGPTESSRRGLKRRVFSGMWRLMPKAVIVKGSPFLIRKFP